MQFKLLHFDDELPMVNWRECSSCGTIWNETQSNPEYKCPECGKCHEHLTWLRALDGRTWNQKGADRKCLLPHVFETKYGLKKPPLQTLAYFQRVTQFRKKRSFIGGKNGTRIRATLRQY